MPAVCLEVINNFASADPQVGNAFFQQYFLSIVQDVFFVLTDTDHKSGFKLQSLLLARMFQLVETNTIQAPLFDPSVVADPEYHERDVPPRIVRQPPQGRLPACSEVSTVKVA